MPETFEGLDWIRRNYKVPAEVGMRVVHEGRERGEILGADQQYVAVRFDGEQHASRCHPLSLDYGDGVKPADRLAQQNAHIDRVNELLNEKSSIPAAGEGRAPRELSDAQIAERFHEAYERMAPSFGYETREASARPWADVPEQNRALMTAVVGEIRSELLPAVPDGGVAERLVSGEFDEAAARAVHEVSDDVLPFEMSAPDHLGRRQQRATERQERIRLGDYFGVGRAVLAAVSAKLAESVPDGGQRRITALMLATCGEPGQFNWPDDLYVDGLEARGLVVTGRDQTGEGYCELTQAGREFVDEVMDEIAVELSAAAPAAPVEGDGRGLTGAAVRAHADRGVIDGPSLLARVLMYAAKGEPPSRGLLADIEAFFDTADAPGEWWVFSDPESDAAKYTAPTAFDAAEKWLADNINADAYDGTEVEAWPLASVKRFVVKQTNEEWSNDVPGARETYEIVPAPSAPVETGDGDGEAGAVSARRWYLRVCPCGAIASAGTPCAGFPGAWDDELEDFSRSACLGEVVEAEEVVPSPVYGEREEGA